MQGLPVKRALICSVVLVGFAAAISPAAAHTAKHGRAPRSAAKARRVLRTDVKKLAGDFTHKRYGAVCSDLTPKELRKLGGPKSCVLKVALLSSAISVKRFALVKVAINRSRTRATVAIRITGSHPQVLHGVFRWAGRKYRLNQTPGF